MNPLEIRIARIEKTLADILPVSVDAAWLFRAVGQECPEARTDWADAFLEPGRDLLARGGKRWRPLVTVLTCEALGGGEKADFLAALTEIPHNGSLIVDDIEDASLTRRGAPAIHVIHGTDLAINMGNLMYFLPTVILEDLENRGFDSATAAALTRDWMAVMRRLHFGQGYDILWHRTPDLFPDEASYLRMCRFKTGSLSSLAARLGARAALTAPGPAAASGRQPADQESTGQDSPEETITALGDAWENLGTGFQILDDVQNLSTGIPGKDRGDDIVEGKKSLPVILHVSDRPGDSARLAALFSAAAERAPQGDWTPVQEAITLLRDSGSIDAARGKGQSLLESGRSVLERRLPRGEGRDLLLGLVDKFRETMI